MSQDERQINGALLRLRREAQGWVLNDMALRACLSVKQVRQLEEGGSSAFYGASVKMTAAKKVGSLLGLSPEEVFVSSVVPTTQQDLRFEEMTSTDVDANTRSANSDGVVDHVEEPVSVASSTHVSSQTSINEESKPKTSLWLIGGLFGVALAVASFMQPKEETTAEMAPPLQVLPSESDSVASAPGVTTSSASIAVAPALVAAPATPSASKAP